MVGALPNALFQVRGTLVPVVELRRGPVRHVPAPWLYPCYVEARRLLFGEARFFASTSTPLRRARRAIGRRVFQPDVTVTKPSSSAVTICFINVCNRGDKWSVVTRDPRSL